MSNAELNTQKAVLQMKSMLIYCFFVVCHSLQVHCSQGPKLYFPFLKGDRLYISENENVSLTFWLDTSACKDPSGDYRMEVETRKRDGGIEYDGKLARWNNTCIITSKRATRCTSESGPAELFKKVNRSHTEIVVRWIWEDDESRDLLVKERTIQLNFSCDSRQETVSKTTIIVTSSIATSLAIVILALTVFIYRRRTSCSKAECETNKKQIDEGVVRIQFDEDIKKQFISKIWRIESHWPPPNTIQMKNKIAVHHTALKHQQDELLQLLLPEVSMAREPSV